MIDDDVNNWVSLNDALATLALFDEAKPIQRLISLLSSGVLKARGDFEFRTYREYQYFQSQNTHVEISPSRWEALATAKAKPKPETVHLSFLFDKMPETLSGELDLECNGFRLASSTGSIFDDDYSESWLSVWDVHVWGPELIEVADGRLPPPVTRTMEPTNNGGRPPKANWEHSLIHLFGKIYREGWKPQSIEEVNVELQNWLLNQGIEVSDTASRERARALFRALEAWDSAES